MRVQFGKLEEMIEELKERLIHEVRVEPLVDMKYGQDGRARIRVYVTVEAIIDKEIPVIGCFEALTYYGFKPMEKDKPDEIYEKNVEKARKLRNQLSDEGFTVYHGHYVEELH